MKKRISKSGNSSAMGFDRDNKMLNRQGTSLRMLAFWTAVLFINVVATSLLVKAAPQGQGGRGAAPAPAGPVKRLPDGKPDIQGYYNSPNAGGAAWNIEPAPGTPLVPATQGAIV